MNKKFFAVIGLSILSQVLVVFFNIGTMSLIKPMLYEIKVSSTDERSRQLALRIIEELNNFPLGLNSFLIISVSIAALSFFGADLVLVKRGQKMAVVGINILFVVINILSPVFS